MNFKMSEKSLFAILLRSSWWISIAIGAGVIAFSRAVLSKELWIFGAMGGVPFLVIGAIAAYRQRHQLSAARVDEVLTRIDSTAWREFSIEVQNALKKAGYTLAPNNPKVGADFVANFQGRVCAVSARRWKAANVSLDALQELRAAMDAVEAREGIYLTRGQMSEKTLAYVKLNRIRVLSGASLAQFLAGPGRK